MPPAAESGDGLKERDRLIGELELQLTRLKLEEQEFLRAKRKAEDRAAYYADLFKAAPVGFLVFNFS
ncbi:MAG TPA: hypothetical protein VG754_08635, partial [Verrucomicrobiae bacterium]|nr:hypothetical protein [Verrucomicrobiae bacterium]